MTSKAHKGLSPEQINKAIRLAWEDRTSFEEMEERMGLTEAEVIQLMRAHLKAKSFKIWRARVSGRSTKHRKRFRASREPVNEDL